MVQTINNSLQYCFCFIFWFFGCKVCGSLAPRTGIKPVPLTLEGEVSTTGLPGKSQSIVCLRATKLQYFGHVMRRTDSPEKTLMLGKIEGRRRRG